MKDSKIKNMLLIFCIILFAKNVTSQVVTISNTTINDCDFTLYDTGGVTAAGYSANQDYTMIICPDAVNQAIVITWFTFTLGPGDFMEIYDGNSTAAPFIGSYGNNALNNITAYASINNPSGCLTLHFVSDANGNGVFNASVKCEIPCAYPIAAVSNPATPIMQVCKGTTLSFDGAASTPQPGFNLTDYHWDFGDQTTETNTTTTTSHTFNNTGRFVVSLEVEDNNGCINKNAAFVEVIVESDPVFTMETLDACEGEIFCMPASVTSPPLPAPTNDIFGAGIHIPDNVGSCFEATQYFNVFPVGSHLTNINDLQNIYANMGHTYIGDLIISIICPSGQKVTMHQQGGGGANLAGDYYWEPNTPNPTWAGSGAGGTLPPGTYASVGDLNGLVGCELNGTWTLEICDMWAQDEGDVYAWGVSLNPALYVDLEALSPTIGSGIDSSILSGPGMVSLTPDGNEICAQVFTAGSHDYTYTVTNSFGCTHDTTVAVTIKPGPKVDFDFDSICFGNTAMFTNQTQGSVNLFNFTWDFGDGTPTESTLDVTHDYVSDGTYTVNLAADAGNGCSDDTSYIIEVYPVPVAGFSVINVCHNTLTEFTNSSSITSGSIDTWSWDFGDNLGLGSNQTEDYTYLAPGSYTTELIVESNNGCSDTIEHPSTVFPNPVVNFTGQNICEGFDVNFNNTSAISSGLIQTYNWDFSNGNTSTQTNPIETFSTEGIYLITLMATSENNCVDQNTATIEVYPTPVPQFITADVCDGTSVSFTDFSNVSNTYTTNTITDWDWNFGDTPAGIATGSSTNYLYASDGTYTITLDIETNNGCVNTLQQNVTVFPNPVVSFTSPNPTGCTELCTDFNNLSTISSGTITNYLWNFGDGNASIDTSPFNCITNSVLVDESYTVTLLATSNNGCQTTLIEPNFVTVYPTPIADFEPSRYETNIFQTMLEFENNSQIGDSYIWNFANLEIVTDESPEYTFPDSDSGSYEICLQTTSIHGCIADTCKIITITGQGNIYIPNTFTPDGDGVNDYFTPSLFGISDKDFTFYIFDRWGALIFISTNPENASWDGTYKGLPSQEDTYIWKITGTDHFNGEMYNFTGHINLLR